MQGLLDGQRKKENFLLIGDLIMTDIRTMLAAKSDSVQTSHQAVISKIMDSFDESFPIEKIVADIGPASLLKRSYDIHFSIDLYEEYCKIELGYSDELKVPLSKEERHNLLCYGSDIRDLLIDHIKDVLRSNNLTVSKVSTGYYNSAHIEFTW